MPEFLIKPICYGWKSNNKSEEAFKAHLSSLSLSAFYSNLNLNDALSNMWWWCLDGHLWYEGRAVSSYCFIEDFSFLFLPHTGHPLFICKMFPNTTFPLFSDWNIKFITLYPSCVSIKAIMKLFCCEPYSN